MGNAPSQQEDTMQLSAMDQQVGKLFDVLQQFQGKEPMEILSRCGPETVSIVRQEVAIYTNFAQMIDRHRARIVDDKNFYGMKETGVQQMLELKALYREALVQFIIAAETGLTMFPLIANNLVDTTDILDAHIKKMQTTMKLLIDAMREGTRGVAGENDDLRRRIRDKMTMLSATNDDIKGKMQAASKDLDDTIADLHAL